VEEKEGKGEWEGERRELIAIFVISELGSLA